MIAKAAASLRHHVSVQRVTIAELYQQYTKAAQGWHWNCPFVTPPWLSAWWQCFGQDHELFLLQFDVDGIPIGFAPLMVKDGIASFIGSDDLCDHLDFPVQVGLEDVFFQMLLRYLQDANIQRLVLTSIRPDSQVMHGLVTAARAHGCSVFIQAKGVAVQMLLPRTWEEYLARLPAKQRHEVRRKFRRLEQRGTLYSRLSREPDEVATTMEIFFDLFRKSRSDKEDFMTAERERFFRLLATELAMAGMLDLLQIEFDGQPAAVVFSISHGSTAYLYNNGFAPVFRDLSIGTVSKVLAIRQSIEEGKKVYDFLNGPERYKYQLGGTTIELMACTVDLL